MGKPSYLTWSPHFWCGWLLSLIFSSVSWISCTLVIRATDSESDSNLSGDTSQGHITLWNPPCAAAPPLGMQRLTRGVEVVPAWLFHYKVPHQPLYLMYLIFLMFILSLDQQTPFQVDSLMFCIVLNRHIKISFWWFPCFLVQDIQSSSCIFLALDLELTILPWMFGSLIVGL